MARTSLERKPVAKEPSNQAITRAINKAVKESTKELEKQYEEEMASIGKEKFTCYLCGRLLDRKKFYKSTDIMCQSGVTPICMDCVKKIVYQTYIDGEKHNPTVESIQMALEYLDKPWLHKLYESSLNEAANTITGKIKNDVWTSYIKNISMKQYDGKRWRDSDLFNKGISHIDERSIDNEKEVQEMYEVNKRTVISALGYDPFSTVNENDKPLMYSKLAGMLDESTNEDEVKLGACIEIVQSFNQAERLNYVINSLQSTPDSIVKNYATIKGMEDTKKNIFTSALNLAKDNGITIKHSNNNTKGANTWTGTVKKLKELKLREQEMNAFDIGTAEGMLQVAELSNNAIMKQLQLDENDYTDMIKTQREMINSLQVKAAETEEELRIFKRENKDLKDFLREKDLINDKDEVIV